MKRAIIASLGVLTAASVNPVAVNATTQMQTVQTVQSNQEMPKNKIGSVSKKITIRRGGNIKRKESNPPKLHGQYLQATGNQKWNKSKKKHKNFHKK